ncbi:MAG: Spy/CpxP family protein refolding chaperone [Acidobacteriia bacterium]|nr:Spy/CpxP family protein refolding chaperone [Terriglobia bacterium]
MKRQLIRFVAAGALAAGMALAQSPAPAPAPNAQATPGTHTARRDWVRQHLARVAQRLNLTDAQKQQARSIFQQARQQAMPIREQLKQNRQALQAAAKSGQGEAQIQQLAKVQGDLLAHMVAIRTESAAKFYGMLTPEQRAKADQMQQQFRERTHNRQLQHNG